MHGGFKHIQLYRKNEKYPCCKSPASKEIFRHKLPVEAYNIIHIRIRDVNVLVVLHDYGNTVYVNNQTSPTCGTLPCLLPPIQRQSYIVETSARYNLLFVAAV